MKIAGSDITFIDFPTVDDWAVIIYFTGCSNNCVNCQNKELQNPDYKSSILSIQDEENLFNFIKDICKKQDTNKIVFSGGDPLYPTNREIIKNFLNKYGSLYDICIYTGYSIDDVKKFGIHNFKFIKCGRYDESYKQTSEKTEEHIKLASSNQNFYDSNYEQLSKNGILNFK